MIKKITAALMSLGSKPISTGAIKKAVTGVDNIAPDMPDLSPSIFWKRSLFDTLARFLRLECRATNKARHPDFWSNMQKHVTNLVETKTKDNFSLDLRDLGGVVNSKSADHGVWSTFEEFGRSENCSSIPKDTADDFTANTRHSFEKRTPLRFQRNLWEDRVLWGNDDGSHHAAAAHVQAIDQGLSHTLSGTLYETSLDIPSVYDLKRTVQIVVVNKIAYWSTLINELESLNVEHASMEFNNEHGHLTALVFPKDNPKSMVAAETLIECGCFDLSNYIHECLTQQNHLLTRKPSNNGLAL